MAMAMVRVMVMVMMVMKMKMMVKKMKQRLRRHRHRPRRRIEAASEARVSAQMERAMRENTRRLRNTVRDLSLKPIHKMTFVFKLQSPNLTK